MANTYTKIAEVVVSDSTAANISFTSIPQTYTDLVVKLSLRSSVNGGFANYNWVGARFNNNTSLTYVGKILYSSNGSTGSASMSDTQFRQFDMDATSFATANTFSNSEWYIPNYTSSSNKSLLTDSVVEANSTSWTGMILSGQQVPLTTGVTSITIYDLDSTLVQYSTATLYGIKNS